MVRYNLDVNIVLLNNDGYSIERAIHGPEELYNDIARLDHSHLLPLFGGNKDAYTAIKTKEEFEDIIVHGGWGSRGSGVQICEIWLGRLDYPWRLSAQVKIRQAALSRGDV
jgi:pyruvate decarboxylase